MNLIERLSDWTLFSIIFIIIFAVLGSAEGLRKYTNKPPGVYS